jgi:hypothetical protein
VQREPKPRVQQVAKDDNFVVPWLRHSLPARGSAGPTMRFFTSDATSVLSIWLRPNVYVFAISLATASRLRFGAMSAN